MGANFDVATAGAVAAAFLAIVLVLLVVTKKSAAPVKQEKKRVAVPVASRPVVVEKVAVREEVVKPAADSRPRTPLQAVGRSSATESPRGFQRTKKLD